MEAVHGTNHGIFSTRGYDGFHAFFGPSHPDNAAGTPAAAIKLGAPTVTTGAIMGAAKAAVPIPVVEDPLRARCGTHSE
jgi:hypothetical protein